MGALQPTVSGIGFYVHKELGAAEVGILSTQRVSRGRFGRFSNEEWLLEGAYGGHVDGNGCFSLNAFCID